MRYRQLTQEVAQLRPCNLIIEIGTFDGGRAKQLVKAALRHNHAVRYYGFDLFELGSEQACASELTKTAPPLAMVESDLARFRENLATRRPWRGPLTFDYDLFQGNTKDTLPSFHSGAPSGGADFVFIDGGHSLETIANDWRYCSQLIRLGGSIVLDDYYDNPEYSRSFGCNQLIEQLRRDPDWDVTVLPRKDVAPTIGGIQMVRVRRRGWRA